MNDTDDMRARVQAQYGDGTMSAGRARFRSGETFQQELDVTHASLLTRKFGAIYRHARETVGYPGTRDKPGTLKFRKGGNPVDYTGHVNIRWSPGYANGAGAGWTLCAPGAPGFVRLPLAFDAKRESSGTEYHCRDVDQKHQLLSLREAAAAGAAAFMLVHCVKVARVFIVGRPEYLNTLLAGGSVRLVDKGGALLLPSVEWRNVEGWPYAVAVPAAMGWDRHGLDRSSKD